MGIPSEEAWLGTLARPVPRVVVGGGFVGLHASMSMRESWEVDHRGVVVVTVVVPNNPRKTAK